MSGKLPKNSLLATGGTFSLADSFSPLPVLVGSSEEGSFIGQGETPKQTTASSLGFSQASFGLPSSVSFFSSPSTTADDPFAKIGSGQTPPESVELAAPTSPINSPPLNLATPVPKSAVGPPPLSLATTTPLYPPSSPFGAATTPLFVPPPVATVAPLTSSTLKRPTYAPDPFIGATASTTNTAFFPLGQSHSGSSLNLGPPGPPSSLGPPGTPSTLGYTAPPTTFLTSYSTPNLQSLNDQPAGQTDQSSASRSSSVSFGGGPPTYPPSTTPGCPPTYPSSNTADMYGGNSFASQTSTSVDEVMVHWFYKPKPDAEVWKPFGVDDSFLIEAGFQSGESSPIPVCGTRYDVYISERMKKSVYWSGQEMEIRRCSWFHKLSPEGRWVPYEEAVATKLESEFQSAQRSGSWQRKIALDSGDWVMMHSPEVIMHFPTSSANHGALDDWGQVQPSSDPAMKPRVVHRGLEGLPDIEDGETETVDHLCFVVHGIGAACDIQFRSIFEVVDNYREMTEGISSKHFAGARLASQANRVEFLPVNWHSKLHGEERGTDNRLKPLTLRSIPKLRSFVNDTLLDVLFYTSPIYCQTILDTVCSEINKMYTLFKERNPDFKGDVSVIGHSLGSLILFDLLNGQSHDTQAEDSSEILTATVGSPKAPVKPRWDKDLSLEEVFQKLGIAEHAQIFTGQGISMEELSACSEEDLKEAELPLGPRKKLIKYLEERNMVTSGFQEFQQSTVTSTVDYTVGPAGTGQPFVKYPKLDIKPNAFFAFGSPIGMFMAVRGIQTLGNDFQFPTCSRFFNIFHPYDPVAYRIESLVNEDYSELRPVLIPHHKGRKRMHLELKETMSKMGSDIKQKFMDSLKAVYSMAGTLTGAQAEEQLEVEMEDRVSPTQELENNLAIPARLNNGRRIDYVLQEAPMESFNEYLWSLASHLCYWQSEDTALLVLKEIYSLSNVLPDEKLGGGGAPQPPRVELYPGQGTMPKSVSMPSSMSSSASSYPPPPSLPMYPSPPSFPSSTPSTSMPTYPSPPSIPSSSPSVSIPSYPMMGSVIPPTPSIGQGPPPATGFNSPATPAGPPEVATGPPPTFFTPSSVPMPSARTTSYPKPVGGVMSGMGMDPTAPLSSSGPVGPPPKMGMDPTAPPSSSGPIAPPPSTGYGFTR